jgi:rRNA maturation protein Nop10
MKKALFICLIAACAAGLSCQEQMIAAFGSNSGITLVTTVRCEEIARDLAASLQREIVTVQYEMAYDVTVITTGDLKNQDSRKNIIVLDFLEPADNLSRQILDLAAGKKDDVVSGRANIFHREDRWARGQAVICIAAPTEAGLKQFVTSKREEIFRYVEAVVQARLNRSLFEAGEQPQVTERLAKTYGWSLRLPPRYDVDEKYAKERVIKILNDKPARMITVYWEDGDWGDEEGACLERKKMLAWKYWDEDEVIQDALEVRQVTFAGAPAVNLTGTWENKKYVIGGTFTTYCFTCPKCGRHYVVDAAVFAPGLDKLPLMRELQAILATFTCVCGG